MTWYSVRCVFERPDASLYAERFTVWWTASIDDALVLAEQRAHAYEETAGWRYVGLAQAYWIGDEAPPDAQPTPLDSGDEVFSLLRDSDLDPDGYVRRFFVTGRERHAAGDGPGWFTVRGVVEWPQEGTYEERITLWAAESAAHAVAQAEQEAAEYAEEIIGGTYLGVAQPFFVGERPPVSGDEVFVLERVSDDDADRYVKAMFDTGRERTATAE